MVCRVVSLWFCELTGDEGSIYLLFSTHAQTHRVLQTLTGCSSYAVFREICYPCYPCKYSQLP
ncbi:hypothetical protein RSAG8_09029, partial [Rhizoctonia solani AG-8 WAC10335]